MFDRDYVKHVYPFVENWYLYYGESSTHEYGMSLHLFKSELFYQHCIIYSIQILYVC